MGKRKNVISLIMVSITCLLIIKLPVHADSFVSHFAWRDDSGNIIYVTHDHHSTARTYRTIGLTISRCVMGQQQRSPSNEYIAFAFDSDCVQSSASADSNGYITTTFLLPEDKFLERIATYYPSWLAELQSEQTCYLLIDSIMCCRDYDQDSERYNTYGAYKDDGSRTGKFYGNTYWNIPDGMYCDECGGNCPCLKDGWMDWTVVSSTPICYAHPNAKEGSLSSF